MLSTLRQRNFVLLWTAGLISYTGDWVLLATLPIFVYERTNSTLASGLVWLMYALSGLFMGTIAGVFVDRWDRRRTLVWVNLLQALVIPFLLLALRDGWLWVVYPVVFLEGSLYAFSAPAENALLPRLVEGDRLVTANALNSLNDNLARIAGPAIGGLILVHSGLAAAVLIDATSYFMAALLIAGIDVSGRAMTSEPEVGALADEAARGWGSVWREWVEGLQLIGTTPLLRGLLLVVAVSALADSLNTPLIVPFVLNVVAAGAATVALILAVRGVAGLLGGVLVGRFGHLINPVTLLGWSLVAIGIGLLVMVNVPTLPVIVLIQLALGPVVIGWLTTQQTLLQATPEDRFRGRVFGAVGTTTSLMAIAGIGVGSALGDVVGIVPLYTVSALLYAAAGLIALAQLRSLVVKRASM